MIERVSPPGFLRRCTRCGHLACPCCQNWCDNLVPDHASVREADRERARTGVGSAAANAINAARMNVERATVVA